MAPLVILVGRNNTGKSYVASLLWAMPNFGNLAIDYRRGQDTKYPVWLTELLTSAAKEAKYGKHTLSTEDFREMSSYVNGIANGNKGKFLTDLFIYAKFTQPKFKLKFNTSGCKNYIFETSQIRNETQIAGVDWVDDETSVTCQALVRNSKTETDYAWLPSAFYDVCINAALQGFKSKVPGDVLYISAARTGLMLAYPTLAKDLLNNLSLTEAAETRTTFPLPTVRFLQALTDKIPRKAN